MNNLLDKLEEIVNKNPIIVFVILITICIFADNL
jgi:hypothetical protein